MAPVFTKADDMCENRIFELIFDQKTVSPYTKVGFSVCEFWEQAQSFCGPAYLSAIFVLAKCDFRSTIFAKQGIWLVNTASNS